MAGPFNGDPRLTCWAIKAKFSFWKAIISWSCLSFCSLRVASSSLMPLRRSSLQWLRVHGGPCGEAAGWLELGELPD